MDAIDGKLLFRPAEAAAVLGLGRSRIFQAIRDNEIPSSRYGRARIISADALREFAERLTADADDAESDDESDDTDNDGKAGAGK
jgi:excisionase family DNA binding protein